MVIFLHLILHQLIEPYLIKMVNNLYSCCLSLHRYNKREEAAEAISALNNVIPQGGNQPLQIRIAEEHGRAKAALYLPTYNTFVHNNRGRLRTRNAPY
jgi:hypothetical protein